MESTAKSRRKFRFRATILIPASMVLAFAQVPSGSLGGTVLDESEAAIQGAKVSVKNQDTALQRSVTSGTRQLERCLAASTSCHLP